MPTQVNNKSQFNTIALKLVNLLEKSPLLTHLPSHERPVENE